jgi:filamentous hemagglutinin family protein
MKYILSLMSAAMVTGLMANPSGGSVVSGSVAIDTTDPTAIVVTSGSDRSIVEWTSFSIDGSESTTFTLPSSTSAILNRVTGSLMTDIEGTLSSNGIVYLINENGIVFGDAATVDVASLLASTLTFSDSDFLNAGNIDLVGSSEEAVTHSSFTSISGDIYLLGYQVSHDGYLISSDGVICLGAGEGMVLRPNDDQRLVIAPVNFGNTNTTGVNVILNSEIHAPQVELKADGSLFDPAVYQEGNILCHGTGSLNARAILYGQQGLAESNGPITVLNSDGTGGEIQLIGDTVLMDNSSFFDASGSTNPNQGGGGVVYIGGGYEGLNNSIPNATSTTISVDAVAMADAGTVNNAGLVVAWSDDVLAFHGAAKARGGSTSGDGGTIEIFGLNSFSFDGNTDVNSPHGTDGQVIFQ